MTTRFENAIRKLIHAFFNDELIATCCRYCPVGNICGGDGWTNIVWSHPDHTHFGGNNLSLQFAIEHNPKALELITKTGYSVRDIVLVENAFMGVVDRLVDLGSFTEIEINYQGICAVIDVLCEIEGYDSEEYKPYFEFNEKHEPVNELI